ncbi:urocanate hydratase [Flectobacillus longus]|uniref:urocanate hydratase n=1 Tax=Flectobacillus longus TaxID=2984207 RepID=UPI0024B6BD53|nr:urocanate hydratase [Flectobacillus longus]MDI9882204.1 urocanate hydratase [Flectobacillus longus]
MTDFQRHILQGIPSTLPPKAVYDPSVSHAPKRKSILTKEEEKLAIRNALRYFPKDWHIELATEFLEELRSYGRIYMYRFRPQYSMYARPIEEYPAQSQQAAAIMLMIQNNLNPAVAQHPHELITYGGNGAVFQNWAQYLLTMQYLSTMTDEQTLHIYSGHPMGLFPSSQNAPRVVVTNGMMIPNYSKPDDWERFNALGVTQYGQMTAGSYMYIGPQGIVHGTTITVMNAFRKTLPKGEHPRGKVFVTSGLGGMSGAQPKAGNIAGCITVCAEVNAVAAHKRHQQGWVDELIDNMPSLLSRTKQAIEQQEVVSIAYVGNIVEVWESFYENDIFITLGSDQTSLHNPWSGGYYPAGLSFEAANKMIAESPDIFVKKVKESLVRHVKAINKHTERGTYFFDYGNAFLLESSRAEADIWATDDISFKYPSYVQDILGPMCFDYGFGPFRWVCTSGKEEDLLTTDQIALQVLTQLRKEAPEEITQQMDDNIKWITEAAKNKLVVGSQARILYADAIGRISIAQAFNQAVKDGILSAPVVLGRDHHDVSGTDSPYRETSNIYDGSRFTADMAIHNVIGDSFRGATWVSIHNGGGVGWGEVINGGFGMLLDGSEKSAENLRKMLFFDVNNGIARRAWARNKEAMQALETELARTSSLKVTRANLVDDEVINHLFE